MTPIMTFPPLPDPNDLRAIERHKRTVCQICGAIFDAINHAFRDAVPKALSLFDLLEGPRDLVVHATNTRYVVKLLLANANVAAEDEEAMSFEIPRIANCGLCIRMPGCEIRILKATDGAIPKSNSDARSRFFASNQLVIPFDRSVTQPSSTLGLVVLWDLGQDYAYTGLEIACPRGERKDGTVDCHWTIKWESAEATRGRTGSTTTTPLADLDEIRPREDSKKKTS